MLEMQHVTDLSGRETLVRITGTKSAPLNLKIDSGIAFGLRFDSFQWFLPHGHVHGF